MIKILQLLRWNNLTMVMLTQYLLYHFILSIPLSHLDISLNLSWGLFALLTTMTATVAAAGYVVNDIYDQVIDRLNKPEKTIVGNYLSEKDAWRLYFALLGIGLIISIVLAWFSQFLFWLILYVFSSIMMFYYSKRFKREPFIGNFIVALFCGLTAIIVAANDATTLRLTYDEYPKQIQDILFILGGYTLFAFLTTLYREIVKDIEDAKGDAFHNCKTLPIILGLNTTKFIAGFIAAIIFGLTVYWAAYLWLEESFWQFTVLVLLVVIPTNMSIFMLVVAKDTRAFHQLSQFIKGIMLGGLLYILAEYFL